MNMWETLKETHHIVSVSKYFNNATRTSFLVSSLSMASIALEVIDVYLPVSVTSTIQIRI